MIVQCHIIMLWTLILEILCEELINPENGTVSLPSERIVDSIATYACNDSFELLGAVSVTCQLNGTWSGDEPICIGDTILSCIIILANSIELALKNCCIEKKAL